MNEILSNIKNIVLKHTDNEALFKESEERHLNFSYQGHKYFIILGRDEALECTVVYCDDKGDVYAIDDELKTLLNKILPLKQDDFTIGIDKFAHVSWLLDQTEIEESMVNVLEKSDEILQDVVVAIEDVKLKLEQSDEPQKTLAGSTPNQSSNVKDKSVIEVVKSTLKEQEWNFKETEPGRIVQIGFKTDKYKDDDDDDGFLLVISHDRKEVIFYTPFLYNLLNNLKQEIDQKKVILRQAKLGLLSLHMTSTRKFITMWYDVNDGEIRYEVRQFLNDENSFSKEQVLRGVSVLRMIVDEFHLKFTDGVMDDSKSVDSFSQDLFVPKAKKDIVLEALTERIAAHADNMEQLNGKQLDEIAKQVASITQKMLQSELTD
ncbi:hypothetical protein BCU94_18980 [Shewanella sp. 10N.286.52.C2]|uniref:hypothetical protein n=1 Tax=Shewanella sp. 10N.286.52.C2 TaxID=1880838 RepID=UPI000C8473F6|nr:hypothetical protein [Shewanella sp. 10N.286.52.C2]PMG27421.1 hypothetical protein BCU94_18980 [Shewanella sp. 10N.286.52.C2]